MAQQKLKVRLSNPLREEDAVYLGLEKRKYTVDEEIEVGRNGLRELIQAGYAQVDPEDPKAVAGALRGETSVATTGSEPAATSGQPEDPAARADDEAPKADEAPKTHHRRAPAAKAE